MTDYYQKDSRWNRAHWVIDTTFNDGSRTGAMKPVHMIAGPDGHIRPKDGELAYFTDPGIWGAVGDRIVDGLHVKRGCAEDAA